MTARMLLRTIVRATAPLLLALLIWAVLALAVTHLAGADPSPSPQGTLSQTLSAPNGSAAEGAAVPVPGTAGFQPAAVAVPAVVPDTATDALGAARRTKCRVLWLAAAPWSFRPELCDFLVGEHERQGIADQWYWSLVYGKANFGLMTGTLDDTGTCYGPFDCKWGWAKGQRRACLDLLPVPCAWRPSVLRRPDVNIRCHTAEMAHYHRTTGREGFRLLAQVFYPASPREYSPWRPTDRQFRRWLAQYYRKQQAAAAAVPSPSL